MTTIHMPLLEDCKGTYRSVKVTPLHHDVSGPAYRIEGTEPAGESWAFPPGTLVRCKWQSFEDGETRLVPVGPVETTTSVLLDYARRMIGLAVGTFPLILILDLVTRKIGKVPEPSSTLLLGAAYASLALLGQVKLRPTPSLCRWASRSAIIAGSLLAVISLIGLWT